MKMPRVQRRTRLVGTLFFLAALALCQADLYLSKEYIRKPQDEIGTAVQCMDRGPNKKNLTWRSVKQTLGPNTRPSVIKRDEGMLVLVFESPTPQDSGSYICTNGVDSKEFKLDVYSKISIANFEDTPKEQYGKEGENISLRCEVKGDARITWYVNGNTTLDTAKYNIGGDGLIIVNASRHDSDVNYTCTAIQTSSGDVVSRDIKLIINHKPVLVYEKALDKYAYIGGPAELECEVAAYPHPTFHWSKKKGKLLGGKPYNEPLKSVLVIDEVTEESFGEYQCLARNAYGTLIVDFTLSKGEKPAPPTNVKFVDANSTAVILEIRAFNESDGAEELNANEKTKPTGFRIEYRFVTGLDNETWNCQEFDINDDNIYVLNDLESKMQYQVRVATINAAGFSDFTEAGVYETTSGSNSLNAGKLSLYVLLGVLQIVLFGSRWLHTS